MTELEGLVGHSFADAALLERALTHRSWAHENGGDDNERLEFLGDAVLQACSTVLLMAAFPDAREGELSRLRSQVVSTPALAEVGRVLGVGERLRLGVGEASSGGRHRQRLLACGVEAILGAIFIDAGIDACRHAVERWLGARIDALRAGETVAWKDPRSRLQEITQVGGGDAPTYVVVEQCGPPHALTFVVEARLGDRVLGRGEGTSKREASRRAAEAALQGAP